MAKFSDEDIADQVAVVAGFLDEWIDLVHALPNETLDALLAEMSDRLPDGTVIDEVSMAKFGLYALAAVLANFVKESRSNPHE